MKVTILGTGSIYSKSTCSSLIIDNNILVDLGPGVVKQLLKLDIDLKNINTLIITHLHSDHILDFPTLIVNMKTMKINHKISIFAPKDAKEKLLDLLTLVYGDYFDSFVSEYLEFFEIMDNEIICTCNHSIKVEKVIHTGIESYGFVVDSVLGITGDSSLCVGLRKIFDESKTIICDCSLIIGDKYHIGIDNIIELLKEYKQKCVILTHLRDKTKELAKEKNIENVLIVEDGYQFIMGE